MTDTTVALHESEKTGHPECPEYNIHTKLATLAWELGDLHK